jgi:hypothetical protein
VATKKKIETALIDGDVICYRAGFAAERTLCMLTKEDGQRLEFVGKRTLNQYLKENSVDEYTVEYKREIDPLSHALQNVKSMLSTIVGEVSPARLSIILSASGGSIIRQEIATIKKYKGNRDNMPRPHWYNEIRDYLLRYYEAEIADERYEADDVLADRQSHNTVICSNDKDLLQVPGLHYDWTTNKKVSVSEISGLRSLYRQVLTGDRTDNVLGIPGVGPVSATKTIDCLSNEADMYDICLHEYASFFNNSPELAEKHGLYYDKDSELVLYKHWSTEEEMKVPIQQIVDETKALLSVGTRKTSA